MVDILLVDDDPMVRDALKKRLERDGHLVRLAGNGNEAIHMVRETRPDLVITDVIMPEREGVETILELKKLHPDLKIIAMSGGGRMGRLDYLKLATNFGADATLTKPFTSMQLKLAVAGLT
jgi:YesN/AraC family two-component response regulator